MFVVSEVVESSSIGTLAIVESVEVSVDSLMKPDFGLYAKEK